MKFIVSSSVLSNNLQSISGIINTSNTLPILDDFLFDLSEDQLKVTASDLETTMSVRIPLDKAEEPGSVAIPAKILLDTLKSFPDIPLSFTINTDKQLVEISAGDGKFKLAGHNSEEYPQMPELEDTIDLEIPAEVLSEAIQKTIFAAGNDELRPIMSGLLCEFSPEDTTFVATDAHKLVRYKRTDIKSESNNNIILPKKPMNQIKNQLSGKDFHVKVNYNQTNASFTFENISLVCRLIEGKYPNYDAVIPKENPNVLTIERYPFLSVIKRVSIFANQSTHQVRLKITGKELEVSAEDIDYSNEAKDRLNCNYEGENMEIGFNSRFLLEMLNNIDDDNIKLEMSAPNRAGILLPADPENKDVDILMLVMPVMLNA